MHSDPLLDSLIAHLETAGRALIAATEAAVAIRDRQATLAAHAEARETDAARKREEARTNPPTLMKRPKEGSTADPPQENAA